MNFIQWCCERGAKSHRKRTKKPWRKRQSRSWRYSFHKYFTSFFYLFLFFNYFTQEPLLYHLFCILFLPTPTTHDPRHLATLIIWSLMGIRKSLSVECCLETKMHRDVKLLCDVMAHTIGYIQVKMRAASFRLARTHTRFTHWRESNSLGAPRLASRGTNSDLLE